MTLEEISKIYDDILKLGVDIKFIEKERTDLITKLYEELYLEKHKENVKNNINPDCEHKHTLVGGGVLTCEDCGKIW